MALAHVCGEHWHAVQRDLIALRVDQDFEEGRLPLCKLVSIVLAAPPGSSVRYALDNGWNDVDPAGLDTPPAPDIAAEAVSAIGSGRGAFDTFVSIEEFEARRAASFANSKAG
jgi:hypothetical protein